MSETIKNAKIIYAWLCLVFESSLHFWRSYSTRHTEVREQLQKEELTNNLSASIKSLRLEPDLKMMSQIGMM